MSTNSKTRRTIAHRQAINKNGKSKFFVYLEQSVRRFVREEAARLGISQSMYVADLLRKAKEGTH